MAASRGISSAGSKSATIQIRLRLPEEFAEFLDQQPESVRGAVFVAVVFGQIPIVQEPGQFTEAVGCLRRLSVLLQHALERGLEKPLATGARQAIKLINRLSRKSHHGYVYRRLRLPVGYADALPSSLGQREHLVRLAVRASAMSISLRHLVAIALSLEDLRNRLMEKLGSAADACPIEEVSSVVQAVLGLSKVGWKGESK